MCTNATILLLDNSITLLLYSAINLMFILSQVLRLHLKTFSLSLLLTSMRGAVRVTLYSLPLMLLFVWFFKQSHVFHKKYNADNVVGVSNDLDPGKMEDLSDRYGIAFRIFLDKPLPPILDGPYWRVTSLSESYGLHWRSKKAEKINKSHHIDFTDSCIYQQTVFKQETNTATMETALDVPVFENVLRGQDNKVVSNICRYPLEEMPGHKNITGYQNTRIKLGPKTKKLLESFRGSNADELTDKILGFFRKQKMTYSTHPKKLRAANELESFLFETKEGYCEHFAGAMATLLRLKGIPARVVVGYAGGKYNELGNYWLISYSDAHAWVEYWNAKTWVRVDPTAIVNSGYMRVREAQNFYRKIIGLPIVEKIWLIFDSLTFKFQKTFFNRDKILSLEDLTYDPWLVLISLGVLFTVFQIRRRRRT
ncbi:MAG: transglutaminaseTgpA domain-containing protein, partial [Candidatus Paceibacterales bacterium]